MVALSSIHGNPRVQTYLVVFGAGANSQTRIYDVMLLLFYTLFKFDLDSFVISSNLI